MGILSDDEFDLEDASFSPPPSPTPVAARAQAVARNFSTSFGELNAQVAKDYAWMCCEEFGLMDVDREDVAQASQMHTHLIAIRQYSRILGLTRSVERMVVESFLNSTEFKDYITRRVQATFLDPSIASYVNGATARLVRHMQLNPKSWHIPPVVQANFLNSKAFSKAIGAIASNFRGDFHRKLKKSVVEKTDISTLASRLCIRGYQPSRDHLKRFALIHPRKAANYLFLRLLI
ncbi:hypothetical protein BDV93DRAFT_114136 [Ceratobasidium sp. AG-I]|nr:hypothetical protein BDV93DRAFT_114136 [Ceratobasidium sp. AG-I]